MFIMASASSEASDIPMYTMHNKFSNFLCFASLCAHLCAMSNNFKCNDENRILGNLNHEFTDVIFCNGIWGEQGL